MQNFDPSTLFIGRNTLHFPRVDSTNLVLKDMARSGNLPEGTIVTANEQTSGRGRQGRTWFGNPGQNVYASVLLRPQFLKANQQAGINFCVSLAIADTLHAFIPYSRVRIKWPNDILINEEKIAGILIETTIGGEKMDQVVVGIGINVNERSFPDDLIHATSMLQQSGQVFRINDVIATLCKKMEIRYQQLKKEGGLERLCRSFNEILYSKGREVEFSVDGGDVRGTLLDVDSSGLIGIEMNGETNRFSQGEIKLKAYGHSN